MRIVLHILKYKVITYLKTSFDLRFDSIIRGIGSLVVFGGFSVGAYLLSSTITNYVLDDTKIGLHLFHRFISMMLFVFFMSVNLGNIVVSYATLYRSAEVEYFLTKPISYTSIFLLKFLDNFLYSSTTLFLVALMVLWGYGSHFGYAWYTRLGLLVFALIPFMFLSACLAVLILMALMKVASRWGFRKVMLGVGLSYLMIVILFFKFSNPVDLVSRVNLHYPDVEGFMMQLDPGFLVYMPNHWVSEFLFYVARGELAHALPFLGILVGVTAAAFTLCLLVAHRFYYRSWVLRFQAQASGNTPEINLRPRWFDFRNPSLLPPQIESLLKKEYFQFFREPSQWIHLIVMMVLVTLFVSSLRSMNLSLRVTDIQTVTYLVLYAFGGFLSSSLALRFVFPMISLEGKEFWSLRSAPIDPRKIYLVRFTIAFFFLLLIAEVVAVFSNVPFVRTFTRRPLLMYFGVYSAFLVSLAMASLNYGFGGYFANFAEKNPIRVSSSQGATLTFLVSLVFLIALVTIVILPLTRYFESLFIFSEFKTGMIVVPGILLYFTSMAITISSFVVGMRSLKRDF
jgi:ABC-2 type transport system permease protein